MTPRKSAMKFPTVLKLLGRARLTQFLRSLQSEPNILACGHVNVQLNQAESLEEIFRRDSSDGFPSGYYIEAEQGEENDFRITFGFCAGGLAGDGGRWTVKFTSDESVQHCTKESEHIH
jgi:hypothetical protein